MKTQEKQTKQGKNQPSNRNEHTLQNTFSGTIPPGYVTEGALLISILLTSVCQYCQCCLKVLGTNRTVEVTRH